jgi:outer membrane protein OmpA-like peptidoglycan-associated protein
MSPRLSAVAAVALLFCTGWKAVLAQTAETAGVNLADPRNAPLALKSDIRTLVGSIQGIVGLTQGIEGGPVGLKANVQDLAKAMTELGAQVRQTEIRVELPGDVLFDFDKTNLKPAAQETLKKLATIIRAKSKGSVLINGYTDSKGNDPYNQKLSQGRANAVKQWLTTQGGISTVALQTRGFGKANPVAPNTRPDGSDDPDGRAKNRRVEVIIPTQ